MRHLSRDREMNIGSLTAFVSDEQPRFNDGNIAFGWVAA